MAKSKKLKTLEKFVDSWKDVEKAGELVKNMSDNRGDNESFDEYYKDFAKKARKTLDVLEDHVPENDAEKETRLNFAATHLQGLTNRAYEYSESNIEKIVEDVRKEAGDERFLEVLASLDPETDGYDDLTDVISDYRELRSIIVGDDGKFSPDLKRVRKKIAEDIDEKVGDDEDLKPLAEMLKALYEESEEAAISIFMKNIMEPRVKEIYGAIGKTDYVGYVRDNVAELKKPDKIEFYRTLIAVSKS